MLLLFRLANVIVGLNWVDLGNATDVLRIHVAHPVDELIKDLIWYTSDRITYRWWGYAASFVPLIARFKVCFHGLRCCTTHAT